MRNPFARLERDLVQRLRAESFHRVDEQFSYRASALQHGGEADEGRVNA